MSRPEGALTRFSTRIAPIDVALTVVVGITAALEHAAYDEISSEAGVLLVVSTLPLVFRSAAPVATVALMFSIYALAVVADPGADRALTPAFAALSAVYAAGLRPGLRPLVLAFVAAVVPSTVTAVAGGDFPLFGFHTLLVMGALGVGRAVSTLGFESEALEARAAELERERDARAAAAVAEERTRIARELHDVIGHSISVMGVQAGAVRRKLGPGQEREREALLAVERIGRDAVAEMHRLLGFLREGDGDAATTSALPTLSRIEDLVAEMRRAGLDVELHFDGTAGSVSPGRELAAFRIVQEALTNVLKHAPGAHVSVRLDVDEAGLEVVVRDDGDGAVATRNGSGHGLVGMRERVVMYGGGFAAAPLPGAGFEVRATLPAGGDS